MATQSVILAHGWDPGTPAQRVAGGAKAGPAHIHFVYPASDGRVSVTFLFGNMIGPFTQRLFDWLYEEMMQQAASPEQWRTVTEAWARSDVTEDLPRVACPTLVIGSERGPGDLV